MNRINDFFDNLVIMLFPKYRKISNETNEIKKAKEYINSLENSNLSDEEKLNVLQTTLEDLIENTIKVNKISDEEISKEVTYDKNFLNDSLEELDKFDYVFILILVGTYITINKVANKYIVNGKDIHNNHNKRLTAKQLKENMNFNRVHFKMPNDKIPEGHFGIENPNGGRAGGSGKINGVSLNHRYIYGHDIFKPFEVFSDLDKIEEVKPFLGSKTLGGISKQCYHLFFDTFSETGIPAPGSTYFMEFVTKEFKIGNNEKSFRIINNQREFTEYFSIHIEDIIKSQGIEGVLYVYFRVRQIINSIKDKEKVSLKKILKQVITVDLNSNKKSLWMANRTFKEYQMGIIIHSLIIWFQLNAPKSYRGKLNYISVQLLLTDLIQYTRLIKKWNVNNRNYLIDELKKLKNLKIPNDKEDKYKRICIEKGIIYSDNIFELIDNCNNSRKIIYLKDVSEAYNEQDFRKKGNGN